MEDNSGTPSPADPLSVKSVSAHHQSFQAVCTTHVPSPHEVQQSPHRLQQSLRTCAMTSPAHAALGARLGNPLRAGAEGAPRESRITCTVP